MPLAIDIRLPREHTPRFPDLCCRCLAPSPTAMLRCSSRRTSIWELLMPWLWLFRTPVRCEVPICPGCRSRVKWHRRWRLLAILTVLAIVVPWMTTWSKQFGWPPQWRRLATLGGVVVVGLPVFVWYVLRPLAVELAVHQQDVDYEFANPDYAIAFHLLNREGACDDWDIDELAGPDDDAG